MTRCCSIRGLATLLAATMMLVGACAAPPPAVPSRQIVPNRLDAVTLEDFDVVSFVDVDLHTALQTREAVETELRATYGRPGHLRWFFHAFDGRNLDFVVARFEAKDGGTLHYVAQRRLRVRRTVDAEKTLGVAAVLREFEVGMGGVRAGMSSREVLAVAGQAEAKIFRAKVGSFDLLYPTFCVRISENRVEHVWRRELCS